MSNHPTTVSSGTTSPKAAGQSPLFAATRWSVVLAAAGSETTQARVALETLCQTYWHPLYAYVRRRGYPPEDAKDLAQEFFTRLLNRKGVRTVSPEKGRFRSFLLASMNNFLADEWDRSRALKRGGGRVITVDFQNAESWFGEISTPDLTPEQAFEHRWAITLLERVYYRLQEEHRHQGKEKMFEVLRGTLAGKSDNAPYCELGRQLNLSEGAVKVAVHRLRQRYRALLRETIAETVGSEEEVEDELRYLFRVLAGAH